MPGGVNARVVGVVLLEVEAGHAGRTACHMVQKPPSEGCVPLGSERIPHLEQGA